MTVTGVRGTRTYRSPPQQHETAGVHLAGVGEDFRLLFDLPMLPPGPLFSVEGIEVQELVGGRGGGGDAALIGGAAAIAMSFAG